MRLSKICTQTTFLGILIFSISSNAALAIETKDASYRDYLREISRVNDYLDALDPDEATPRAASGLRHDVLEYRHFKDFSEVMARLHPDVEKETDIFFLMNTSDQRNQCSSAISQLIIPNQHMVMIERVSNEIPVFQRQNGSIVGLNPEGARVFGQSLEALRNYDSTPNTPADQMRHKLARDREIFIRNSGFFKMNELAQNQVTPFIPISSGVPAGGRILTYSGIFRANEERTNSRRNSNNTVADPMQFSVYIDGEYGPEDSSTPGREAALALHGTTPNHWSKLGKVRASSGCIRVHTDFSEWVRYYLFHRSNEASERNMETFLNAPSRSSAPLIAREDIFGQVKLWSRKNHFPSPQSQFVNSPHVGGKLRVLFVFFDQDGQRACI